MALHLLPRRMPLRSTPKNLIASQALRPLIKLKSIPVANSSTMSSSNDITAVSHNSPVPALGRKVKLPLGIGPSSFPQTHFPRE